MAGVIRGTCKSCSFLQSLTIKGALNRSYTRPQYIRYASTTYTRNNANPQSSAKVKKNTDFFDTLVQEKQNIWHTIEHDVTDLATFDIVKQQYLEKVEEMIAENQKSKIPEKDLKSPENKATKKVKKRFKPNTAKYTRSNQLTYQGEQNVLAEIDVYFYLGEVQKAYNLFNFHRRHGHKFNLEAYNKVIHAWASEGGWKHVQMLYQNLKRDGLIPTHQTFAGLLEAVENCVPHEERIEKVENVLADMEQLGLDYNELFQKAQLSDKQISSVVSAIGLVHFHVKNEYQQARTQIEEGATQATSCNQLNNRDVRSLIQRQLQNELRDSLCVKSIATSTTFDQVANKRAKLYTKIIDQWKKDFLLEYMRMQHVKAITKPTVYERCMTYTKVLTPQEITDIIFDHIVPILCSQPNGVPVSFVCRRLGFLMYQKFSSKFRHESGVTGKIGKIAEEYFASEEWAQNTSSPRERWMEISRSLQYLASEDLQPTIWPTKLRTMASSVLLDILKKVALIDTAIFINNKSSRVEQCLQHCYENIGYNKIGILCFHNSLSKLYTAYISQLGDISFDSTKLPLVIPPRPWTSTTSGAYLMQSTDLVRTITGQYKLNQLKAASDNGQLSKIFDSLNYLGNTAWKVNGELLDLMIELFNGQGDMELDIIGPHLPRVEERKAKQAMTYEEKQSRKRTKKLFHELFALRMDLLYKLSVANFYRDQVIWTPSSLDFRGRVYPVAPHCSHIGNDVSRSLLSFAEGKKLGVNGLNWLKVHLVNVHGQLKKSSLKDRMQYANHHMDEIFDSADRPLDGNGWWKGGSEPWQTLLACMEITKAIRSGDPENYVSHMAVHMDGSCNGLQHYAALGQDEYGARQVNLVPADRPQDVYSEVANLVEKKRAEDAHDGVLIAQQLEGKVTRKVVKQTVMTVVYGVTFVGGRLQIEKQLKDLDVPTEIIFKASVYVVQEVFKSLSQMFTSARQIQDWLTVSAAQIALTGNCVDWVTPLGLPVIQPYHRETSEAVPTPLQYVSSTTYFDQTQVPHLTKQKGGFPPNFVHSLDSCHMMMTAIQCRDEGMTFASVHDSFWTHACDIEKLNKFCREEFVALHQLPILEDLKKHFDEKYAGLPLRKPLKDGSTEAYFADLPQPGTFDIKQVLDSVYFFS